MISHEDVMKKLLPVVSGIVLCFSFAAQAADPLPRAKPEEVGMSSERLALIGRAINGEIAAGQMPGAVLAVARRGKLVYFDAFGYRDKAASDPLTTDAIFSIASMTKPMVAVGALQLYEQGRLLMDDPLAKYFPRFADMQVAVLDANRENLVDKTPAARKITIQDLFRHTSGLSYGTSGTTAAHKMFPLSSSVSSRTFTGAEFMDRLSTLPLPHQPGTVWEYSLGLDALGLVIESMTEQTLGQYLEEKVWKPLGMIDTGFIVPPEKAGRYARALPNDPVTGQPQSGPPSPMEKTKFECGGGCAVSTAGDYLRFAWMLVNKGQYGEVRILGRKTVEYMLSNQLGPGVKNQVGITSAIHANYGFGLGVAVRQTAGIAVTSGSVGDFSWPGAYGTYWWGDPREQLAVVWMVSAAGAPGPRYKFQQMIRTLVNQAILD
jgi:CubicO group peptidase (beta-lactamase class C family)